MVRLLEGRGEENGEEHQSLRRRSLSKTGKFLIVVSVRHLSDSAHVVMVGVKNKKRKGGKARKESFFLSKTSARLSQLAHFAK